MEKMTSWRKLDDIGRKIFEQLKAEARAAGVPFHYREDDEEFITRLYPDGHKVKIFLDENGVEREEPIDG